MIQDDKSLAGIPPTELSRVIGLIYDCAIDPGRWETAIQAMCQLIDSRHGGITILNPQDRQIRFAALWSGDPEWPLWARLLHERYAAEMPLYDAYMQYDVGEPMNTAMLQDKVGRYDFYESAFYREWAKPQGLKDHVGAVIVKTPRSFCVVTLHTHDHQNFVGPRELAIGRLLVPHVRRAVLIGDLLEMRILEAHSLSQTLDLLGTAVVLTDGDSKIVHANAVAQTMLTAGDPITRDHGRLGARSRSANPMLLSAVGRAAHEDEPDLGQTAIGLPIPFADGRPAIAHVLPLARPPVRNGLSPSATVAVFIGTGDTEQPPCEAIAALYDLTPAEQRVLDSVLAGRNQAETAHHLKVADSTVKTHLGRIFSKTRTASQSELQRLAERLSARLKH